MTQRIVDVTMDGSVVGDGTPNSGTVIEESKLPEKFKGKSVDDIIASYENLEKELGRKGNELGELRTLTDKLIQRGLQDSPPTAPTTVDEEISDDDFLNNPVSAVQKIVEKALKPHSKSIEEQKREQTLVALKNKHPNMMETVQDKAFQDWIMSSQSRQLLWGQASNGSFEIADELFTEYEARTKTNSETTEDTTSTQRSEELAAATTVSSGTASEGFDLGVGDKNVLSRAKLIRLQIENPAKYREMLPMIMKAYEEKRVR